MAVLFVNDPATTDIYTLSLHDALPILVAAGEQEQRDVCHAHHRIRAREGQRIGAEGAGHGQRRNEDRKSTRLNSSPVAISYAGFCLKKQKMRAASSADSCTGSRPIFNH